MGNHLPPRYVNAPSSMIYSDLPRSIILTGVRIWGLGWKHGYRRTESIPSQHLCDICGLSRTQLYEHLARLVATGVLRYTNTDGQFTFHFDWAERRGPTLCHTDSTGPSPENRTSGALSVAAASSSREELSPHEKQQHSTHTHAVGGECERGGGASGKPDQRASGIPDTAASEMLDTLGIGEPTRSKLLRMAHVTHRYLEDWLAWYESQDRLGTGWVVTQIRDGAAPPPSQRKREAADRRRYLAWGGERRMTNPNPSPPSPPRGPGEG